MQNSGSREPLFEDGWFMIILEDALQPFRRHFDSADMGSWYESTVLPYAFIMENCYEFANKS